MTTVNDAPTVWQAITFSLAKKAERARTNKATRAHTWVQTLVTLTMQLAGFTCLTFAGFTWNITAGLVVAAFSCFALAWLTNNRSAPTNNTNHVDPMARR